MDLTIGASSSSLRWSFDVFLSFRGEDTRPNFTSHLDIALRQRGINVFIDYKLPRGEQISTSLIKTIEQSRISIVIISQNYASSSWCLDELVKIIECMDSERRSVIPLFFKVEPSDVRNQTKSFGDALAEHQAKFSNKIQAWREALTTIGQLSGWVLQKQNEADIIQHIVREVLNKLNRKVLLNVARYPVRIDDQIQISNLLFDLMSDGITTVGIYGIGGMGKTTLAKALYNKIADQFEGYSFLPNVREASKQFNGLVRLQKTLLSDILMGEWIKVDNLDRGINIINDRLCSKKILLVLDDVDEIRQLQVLAGGHDWFGPGSKIIVTTRDKQLLSIHGFDVRHAIGKLSDDKALELLSWHAFKKSHPPSGYSDLSRRVLDYCKGLPLALVVLGSFLCDRDQSTWKGVLDANENSSLDKRIQDILQISYDGLEAQTQEMFLDISCLFIGENINDVKKILEACGSYPEKGITNLMDLSLINPMSSRIEMHELIQQMGRTISLSESPNPRKRKRLFIKEDVEEVLNGNKEARAVKAIKLVFAELDIGTEGFRSVKNLIFLKLLYSRVVGDLPYMPNSLRCIEWSHFPFSSFPPTYMPKNLVQLSLPLSSIKHLGKGVMNWESLKEVDLSGSKFLMEIPDFSTALNLERLDLTDCTSLVKVHESVGSLGKLESLHLWRCCNLEQLPSYLKLKSLRDLILVGCKKLEQFPHIGEEMKTCFNLTRISLGFTNIKELPLSIKNLPNIKFFGINYCKNFTTLSNYCSTLKTLDMAYCSNFRKFPSSFLYPKLNTLNLKGCNISDLSFLEILSHGSPSLFELNLSRNTFSSLPSCIVKFKSLKHLDMRDCNLLEDIQKVPEGVGYMDTAGCISLARFPDNIFDMISYSEDQDLIDEDYEYELYIFRQLILMNCDIPEWYTYKNAKNSITFMMPHHLGRRLKVFVPCVVFQVYRRPTIKRFTIPIQCKVSINNIEQSIVTELFSSSSSEYMWLIVIDPIDSSGYDFWDVENLWDSIVDNNSMETDWINITVSFEAREASEIEADEESEAYDEDFVEIEMCVVEASDVVNIERCGVHVVYKD